MQWTSCHFKVDLTGCPVLPCPALPCPATPCPVLPCPVLPCPAIPSCFPSYQHRSTPFGCCSSSVKVGRNSLKVFGFLSGAICNWYQVPDNHPSLLENLSVAMQMIHKEHTLGHIACPFTSIQMFYLVISPLDSFQSLSQESFGSFMTYNFQWKIQ